jgi:hypothetical protein
MAEDSRDRGVGCQMGDISRYVLVLQLLGAPGRDGLVGQPGGNSPVVPNIR